MIAFLFKARDGKPDFGSEANRARFVDTLRHYEGHDFRIEKVTSKRTLGQNAFYWFYLNIIERETGSGANELHEYFKRTHLPPKWIKVLGKEIRIPNSTKELSKHEMSVYMDKIAIETNIPIPYVELYKKLNDMVIEKAIDQKDVKSLHEGLEVPKGEVQF
jgi:hypothetical protein